MRLPASDSRIPSREGNTRQDGQAVSVGAMCGISDTGCSSRLAEV